MADELIDLLYDLSSVGMETPMEMEAQETGKFEHIDVESIHPEAKDLKRARDLAKLPKNSKLGTNNGPLQGKVDPQAKAITNSTKLIRRAKAVIAVWGIGEHETVKGTSNAWEPFKAKMIREGFSAKQVDLVKNYEMPWREKTDKQKIYRSWL